MQTLNALDIDALIPENVDDDDIAVSGSSTSLDGTSASIFRGAIPSHGSFNNVTSFIIGSRIFFMALRDHLPPFGDVFAPDEPRSATRRLKGLQDLQHEYRYILDNLPPGMRQWELGPEASAPGGAPVELSLLQLGIAHANLHVSHLWIQSHLLDKIDGVLDELDLPPSYRHDMLMANWREREHVCRQLLQLLRNTSEVYLEPNGNFLVSLVMFLKPLALTFDCGNSFM
jgi:hypothetical protein